MIIETEYTNMSDMFSRLNNAGCEYVVLRNYNNLLNDEIYMAGHGDVDMLCRDVRKVVDIIGAKACRPQYGEYGDNVHFYIMYKGKKVSIDLRSVGDGYYCEQWEEAILKSRVMYGCFYIMNEENQYYSLIYHAIFQKNQLSEEYRLRLSEMNGISIRTESQLIDILETYMKKNNYKYVFCKDHYVPLRMCMHDKSLCCYNWKDRWPHFKFDTRVRLISFMVKVKHAIWKR